MRVSSALKIASLMSSGEGKAPTSPDGVVDHTPGFEFMVMLTRSWTFARTANAITPPPTLREKYALRIYSTLNADEIATNLQTNAERVRHLSGLIAGLPSG